MSAPIDLEPAARRMARLVEGTPGAALAGPTPCTNYTVADLLDHIAGSALAFHGAAKKQPLPGGPSGNGANLPADWRTEIPRRLSDLADAWRNPAAWTGMTVAGGVDLPGEVAGVGALDELVIHGWDLAKATVQPAGYDGPGLDAVFDMVRQFRAAGVEGLFGPPVPVTPDAPLTAYSAPPAVTRAGRSTPQESDDPSEDHHTG